MYYMICNIPIEILRIKLPDNWKLFQEHQKSQKVVFSVTFLNYKPDNYGIEGYATESCYVFRYNAEVMLVDRKWENARIFAPVHLEECQVFLTQLFLSHAVHHRRIQFHSSLIDYQGRGIMFLGPSGIGKTTQAERWNEYRGAVIINGDIVYVQETEDQFLGWGTPWHGSSPYCENASVPLEALVILKQSRENRVRRLEGFEMVAEVSNSVFYPTWLENGMDLCLETLDHLLTHVPVYLLENRADEEAVALLEQTLDQNKKE